MTVARSGTRRSVLVGGAVLGAVLVAGLTYELARVFIKRYPPTPYDDLFALLSNRDAARKIGGTFLATHTNFTPQKAAEALRLKIGKRKLQFVLEEEVARDEMTEAGHWVLPQTLVGLCALAAEVS